MAEQDSSQGTTSTVLVAGAGPVGLTMAAELARLGIAVRIVDKVAVRSDKSKALVLWTRTLELMRVMGCVDAFTDSGLRATHAVMRSGSRQLARIGFGQLESPYPYGILLPQSETERLLESHLNEFGVRVERETELVAFADDASGVDAELRHVDGREERLRCDWLIGCDGAHSTVRHTLGLEFEGEAEPNDWLLADVHLDGFSGEDEVAIFLHRHGVLALFPMGEHRYRVIADRGPRSAATADAEPTLDDVQAMLDGRGPGGLHARDPVWLTHFGINERKVRDYRAGRVFLAGDAAHIHSPAGGQGMNTGIQDACNLAWKLALVCRGVADPQSPLLDSYSPERSAVAEHVLSGAAALTRMGTLRNPVLQALRNAMLPLFTRLPALRRAIASMLGELDIAYRESVLSRKAASATAGDERPGERVPDQTVRSQDGESVPLYEYLRSGRFCVLASREQAESQQAADVLKRFGDVCELATSDRPVRELRVVRPDGYLGLEAGPDDWKAVTDYLIEILSPVGGGSEHMVGPPGLEPGTKGL